MRKTTHQCKRAVAVIMTAMLAISCFTAYTKTENRSTAETAMAQEDVGKEAVLEETGAQERKENSEMIPAGDDGTVREDLTALELVRLMGNGTNLGNTMEAYGHASLGTTAKISSYETLWGQPVTTQEMITGMKEAGFDSIRIPVAWTNAMNFESGDYTIGEDYLNRVEEIINYARNASMYVIINDHWDGSWWGMFGSSNEEDREKAMEMYVSMWTQIAERYKDYSDYLIFESGNEELGDRLNDIDICKDSGSLSEDECYKMTNKINQTFVNTIRSTGGNNKQRFLLIAGYNTDIERTCDDRFVMPADTAEDKLLVSVHYYTPWTYCGTLSVENWGTVKDYEEQNTLFKKLSKFTEQGYGVIIGEYAVMTKDDGTIKNNTGDFVTNLLDNCDLYGYCPMLWDCSSFFIRKDLKFVDEELANIYTSRSFQAQIELSEEEIQENARRSMEKALTAAPETFASNVNIEDLDGAVAWIMFNSNDWMITYSSGDIYNPDSKTGGLVTTDVQITGEGTYTVALDFTGTEAGYANGTAFSALAVSNGELLYPGYVIDIKEVLVNGEPYELIAKPYTTSDDGKCTRVNLYNGWVSGVPSGARTADGSVTDAAAVLVDNAELTNIETLEITFDYVAP